VARVSLSNVLIVNAGSTSVKLTRRVDGHDGPTPSSLDEALQDINPPDVVLHRVVHGGARRTAVVLDDAVMAELRALTELAPLHQPPALDAAERCRLRWPQVIQVACFDTSFHATMPPEARTYALPARLRAKVQVYGFHGLSHAWSARRVADAFPSAPRVLVAHLGGGQSLCGILDGRSVVTTMGFTPLDGLVMATRSGTIDPGALLWLAAHTDEDLSTVLEVESGLKGLAGTSDMKTIVDRAADGDDAANLALTVWLHRFLRQAGGCIAVLGGIDALVFTGGIGEHSAPVRSQICASLGWLGVALSEAHVAVSETHDLIDVSATDAAVRTLVVHAREDLQMIHEATALLQSGGPSMGSLRRSR
jgi:acetate kinase